MEDIESDLSVFHRIDDWQTMSALKFVSLVERLPFYRGALRDIVLHERSKAPDQVSSVLPPHDESTGLPPAIEVLKAS